MDFSSLKNAVNVPSKRNYDKIKPWKKKKEIKNLENNYF
jgi:hypothetical protein